MEFHLSPPAGQAREQLSVVYQKQTEQIRAYLQEQWPGTLVTAQENVMTCLVEEEVSERLVTGLRSQIRQLEQRKVHLWAGVSNPCYHIGHYRRGAEQANEALQIGLLRNKSTGEVTRFDEVGVYRYVRKLPHQIETMDVYQQALERVEWYGKQQKISYLKALREYLIAEGNIGEAAHRLHIHRNTMSSQLKQLQKLCGEDIDLRESSNRVVLLVALMNYELFSDHSTPGAK